MAHKTKDLSGDKPAKDRPTRAARGSIGSTLLGLLIGMALGLGIAAVVAIYVTRAPVPFVNKLGRSSERIEAAKSGGELADPNKPLAGKPRAAGSTEAASSDVNSILNIFKDAPQVPPGPQAAQPPARTLTAPAVPPRAPDAGRSGGDSSTYPNVAPATTAPGPAAAASSAAATAATSVATAAATDAAKASSSYLLQAGSFRGQDDADTMRAKLALLGFEARVLPAEVEGRPVYRVRVGPYGQLEDMNRARAKLAENGIEATVIRQR